MNDTSKIGDYIREHRELSGMSISEVADASELSEATIKNLTANKVPNPGFWSVANVVKAIDGSLDEMADIPRPSVEAYQKQISDLDSRLKSAEKDCVHMQANLNSQQLLLDERAASNRWLRRAIIIISCVSLALLIFVCSVLIYDIRHPSKGYFTDNAGNVLPYSTGDDGNQDQSKDGDIITTGFDFSINE